MSTITPEQSHRIASLLANMTLPKGLGTEESACSIAAINLALTGTLTDDIPPCMSTVIGRWIISVQDAMPSEMRNSSEWKRLLPLAAGTGRDREQERLAIVMEWMWADVLPVVQPIAAAHGFGDEWRAMLQQQTADAARAAEAVAETVAGARVAASAATAAKVAARAAGSAAVFPAVFAAVSAAYAAVAAVDASTWQQLNPYGLLQRLIDA